MSQRGSFVTEYIYCDACAQALGSLLTSENHKFLCAPRLRSWQEGETLPSIAGKVGGLYDGEEVHVFELALNPQIEAVICHPLTIVVLPEGCPPRVSVFHLQPRPRKAS